MFDHYVLTGPFDQMIQSKGDEEDVVEHACHGNELGQQVDRRENISQRRTEQKL